MTRLEHRINYNSGYDAGYDRAYNGLPEEWSREEFELPLWGDGYRDGYRHGSVKYDRFVKNLRIEKEIEKDRSE